MDRVLLLVPSHHGVVGASVHLPWEPACIELLYIADWWACPPLAVTVTLGTHDSKPSMTSWRIMHEPERGSQTVITSDPREYK
jgi:hypothetical protein